MFHASLLAYGGLLAIFDVPWLVEALPLSLPSCLRDILLVCMSQFPYCLFSY